MQKMWKINSAQTFFIFKQAAVKCDNKCFIT